MKKFILICLALSTVALAACVEVRDPEEDQIVSAPPVIAAEPKEKKAELLIDEEMYVYQGQILTMDQIERLTYKRKQNWTPTHLTLIFGKIEITSRGKLYTMGNDVNLIVDEFASSRGQIETLPPGTKAALDKPGMNGGYLMLQIGRGEGQLFVTMRGQEGGNGSATANNRFYHDVRQGMCPRPFDISQLNGIQGKPGRQGGDSGSFQVKGEIKDLDIRVHQEPGRGGAGGAPGQPGECVDEVSYSTDYIHWTKGNPASAGSPGADGQALK